MKLFCFPYAGGSASFYNDWKSNSGDIEIIPIEYPGHGAKYSEPMCNCMDSLTDTLLREMIARYGVNTLKNFSFFGHSMGAIVAYEIAVKLLDRYGTKVNYLFLSSKASPNYKMEKMKNSNTLIDHLKEIGGISEEILETDDFMNVFFPIIKSDYNVLEGYHIKSLERKKLDSKAVLLLGSKDIVKKETVLSWSQYIKYIKELYLIEGDHFYLNNKQDTVMAILQKYLIEHNYKLPKGS